MTSLYVHLSWFFLLSVLLILSTLLSFYISYSSCSIYLSFDLFNILWTDLNPSFYFDYMSSWFFTTIVLISTIVSIYSFFYMAPYSNSIYFLWLTILFVMSILLVVSISNLFFVILGWDGLGLVSFFLIVYYQNQSSITSGLFTLLINRIGDCFFLIAITLFFYTSQDLFVNSSTLPSSFCVVILMLTFITNSAIFPFSPWLPIAIAAPTPISALVHSSTLVTSGLFLIMRYSYFLYSYSYLINFLLVLSVFTSFYAGINTIFENDLNKLIALSTLSHLGFICMSFSLGLLDLAFFHIISHALFKSLLFMTIGDIIINLSHSQDIRYLSNGSLYTPFSVLVINVSLLNLLGLPNLSGFFSNDLVLESLNYCNLSYLIMLFLFLNVFFTFYYSLQLFYFSLSPNNMSPFFMFHSPMFLHSTLIFVLSLFTLFFGNIFMSFICQYTLFLTVPSLINFFPFVILSLFFLCLVVFLNLFTSLSPKLNYYFSSIIFLSEICINISSYSYLMFSSTLVNSLESGSYNYILNSYPSIVSFFASKYMSNQSILNPLLVSFLACFFSCLFLFLLILNLQMQ